MREKELATEVIWLRHGQTDFPTDRIYCDRQEDPPLNAAGQAQAEAAGRLLAGSTPVATVYASPAGRTWMTAEVAAAATGTTVIGDERLRERYFGVWEGLYFDEIQRDYPDEHQAWKQDQAGYAPEEGENAYDLQDRVQQALADIIARHPGERVVIATHVGPIRVALTAALTMPTQAFRRLTVDYGSLSRVDYGRRQHNLIYLNLTSERKS